MPDDLKPKVHTGKDFPKADDLLAGEFRGVGHYCEWAGDYAPLVSEYEKNGETHYVLGSCSNGYDGFHKHGGDEKKTEIILYPDGGIGMSCFSDDCYDYTLGRMINRINMFKGENYPHRIFAEENISELLSAFDVQSADIMPEAEPLSAEQPAEPQGEAGKQHWLNEKKTGGFTTIRMEHGSRPCRRLVVEGAITPWLRDGYQRSGGLQQVDAEYGFCGKGKFGSRLAGRRE